MYFQRKIMKYLLVVKLFLHLLKNTKSQSYYQYEGDTNHYPEEFRSTNEMPGLHRIDHSEESSMRALAGILGTDDRLTTPSQYFTVQHDITGLDDLAYSNRPIRKDNSRRNNKQNDGKYKFSPGRGNDNVKQHSTIAPNVRNHGSLSLDYDTVRGDVKDPSHYEVRPPNADLTAPVYNKNSRRTDVISTTSSEYDTMHNNNIQSNNTIDPFHNVLVDNLYNDLSDQFSRHSNSSSGFENPFKISNLSVFDATLSNGSSCDAFTHAGCDVIHYERCNQMTGKCQCLSGFLRENIVMDTGACKAVSFYHGHVTIGASGSGQSYSSKQLHSIKERLLTLIQVTFKKHGITGVLDLDIGSVERKGREISLAFDLGIDKDAISTSQSIQNILSEELVVTSEGDLLLDVEPGHETARHGNRSSSLFSALVEVNPCINKDHNPCGLHASCSYQERRVTCQCDPGYEDLEPNLYRLPGELCVEKCQCHNGGLCIDDDVLSGTKQCSCLNWYFGSECQIDGKELLLICCCSVGSLILLGLTMCCCYYGCAKHRVKSARSRMFPFSPDISILKLPRVWMDTGSYHDNELSPPNVRRLSIASERNPYLDGYIMEDIPMGTLQRHGDNHSTYYQPSLAHCPATMSSHSFYRY